MQVNLARTDFSDVEDDIKRHLESLPGPIDSFLEDHVRASNHYVVQVLGVRAGFSSIYSGGLITQFFRSAQRTSVSGKSHFRLCGRWSMSAPRSLVGAATVALLIQQCSRRSMRAVAGCWYYNHSSRRTLERAGMITRTRLLKVEY